MMIIISAFIVYTQICPLLFSSNRGSAGRQFDLVQGIISYAFDQTNGAFWLGAEITTDPFLTKLTPDSKY